eukprot:287188-Amphidinium_carterae.1
MCKRKGVPQTSEISLGMHIVGSDKKCFGHVALKVKQTAQELKKSLGSTGLDVLCNNAGIMATKDEATADGCDTQMQTNHLSHFLLTAEVRLSRAACKSSTPCNNSFKVAVVLFELRFHEQKQTKTMNIL